MGTARRVVLPVLLAVVTVAATAGAVLADRTPAASAEGSVGAAATTPVLSARRLPVFVTTPGADLTLRLRLVDLVKTAPPDSCFVAVADGRDILDHQPDRSVVPASNEKTPLAAGVLAALGPDHVFTTELRAAPPNANGVIAGDAWLVGGGDPQLSTEDYSAVTESQGVARTALEDVADAIAAAGVTRITGRLLADESRYDTARYVQGWPPRFAEQNQTGPLSALSVNDGFGSFPRQGDPGAQFEATPDPPRLAASTLAFLLAGRGVTIDGGVAAARAPASAELVASVDSAPLSELVGEMLTYSDNQTAELLLKELGYEVEGEGTTAAGARALTQVLTAEGFDLTGAAFVDGSGLSAGNRTTCALLADILDTAGTDSALGDGLAVAGERGTLAEAFVDTPAEGRIKAKTGSLNDVTSLAGFVDNRRDDDLVFSLVLNRAPFIEPADVALRDAIGLVMADYPERPPLDEVGPRPLAP